ncbi:hypothetical protein [uncultured Lacinutrix sp.]|uniref:hypothetical protein n=1 Tax=uncultured Lacinutrix sp. TaxID=574032 RepID=UPI00262E717C|nr:hypothetical protein [uncultured Lacinutrix sp.]
MKKIIFLIAILFITFISCDGRDRSSKTNTEVLKEHKLLDSFSEKVEYFPKKYTEVITDTLLANGFKIKIKSYTDIDNGIVDSFKLNNTINKSIHRNWISEIKIHKDGKLLFDDKIDKAFLVKHDKKIEAFSKKAISIGASIYYKESMRKDAVTILVGFCVPESDDCLTYLLEFDSTGHYKLENIKLEETY